MARTSIDAEWTARTAESYVGSLEHAYGDEMPEEMRRRIQPPTDPTDAVAGALRWFWSKHYYIELQQERERRHKSGEETKEAAALALLRREPVAVTLSGRSVHVTSRSYAAMAHIARHWMRIERLAAELDYVTGLFRRLKEKGIETARQRHLIVRLERGHYALYMELLAHRQALYAHAFTATGSPATSPDDAPDWWSEIDPGEDALLLAALHEAGAGRYQKLGAPPQRPQQKGQRKRAEDFGWASLFSEWEGRLRLEPAALYDHDLAQFMTWARAQADVASESFA